ncbi:MAG: hypothetical protein MZW92_07470 [Comamonadaceae bacterium]|nr:hypothetical protein [Comamonadaceae bacterium]
MVRRRSTLHGWGVFALDPIPKNTRIVQLRRREDPGRGEQGPRGRPAAGAATSGCFSVNRRWVRDAEVGGNIATLHQPRLQARTATARSSATPSGSAPRAPSGRARS